MQMILAHLQEAPPSARRIRPDIPVALDDVLLRCLAKQPADRFESARAFAQALATDVS